MSPEFTNKNLTCRTTDGIQQICKRNLTKLGGSGGRGTECKNGLKTKVCSALRSLETSPTLATGRVSEPLKKGGIGYVPVVGDGSD